MPILQVILQQEIEDVLVVVTRYFGGIKLGQVVWYEPIPNRQPKLTKGCRVFTLSNRFPVGRLWVW